MIGVHRLRRNGSGPLRGLLALTVALVACGTSDRASAARIEWTGAGPYEACLEQGAGTWFNRIAELVVAEDAAARATTDADVAGVTIDLMKACDAKGTPANAANEGIFTKYMARWREHVYELTKVIRATGGSD